MQNPNVKEGEINKVAKFWIKQVSSVMFISVSRNVLQKANNDSLIDRANSVQREAEDLHEGLMKGDSGNSSNLGSDILLLA